MYSATDPVKNMADYRAGRLHPSSSLSSIASVDRDRDLKPFSRAIHQANSPPYDPYPALRSMYRPDVTDDGDEDNKSLSLKKRRKKRGQITANLSGTRYDIIRQMVEHLGYTVTKEDDPSSFLIWNDAFVSTEKISELKPFQHINHFPGMGEVTRKDCLARNMTKIQKVLKEEYSFSPLTWVLPGDTTALINYAKDLKAKKKYRTFIVKPPNGSQGHGIGLYRNVEKIPPNEPYIVQEYIDKPLLIEGYKFDLRIYVLVTSCDPLRIFLYKDGLVRLSTEKYLPPQENNLNRLFMHLTNYSINKHNEFYEKGSTTETGSKRSIQFFNDYLRRNDYDVVLLWKNISDLIIKTMVVSMPHVLHAYRMCRPGATANSDSVCFEVLGFDVIIDRKLRPWLLEINRSPSFGTDEKIDFDIKSGVIEDALRLLNIKPTDKKRNLARQKAEAQKRLLRPSKRSEMSGDLSEAEKKRLSLEKRKEELKDLLSRIRKNAAREEFENKHSGGFRRIFPTADRHCQEMYTRLIMTSFQTFLSSRAASMQREIELVYNNKLREQQVLDMLAECQTDDEKCSQSYQSRDPKPLSSMPSIAPQPEYNEDDDDDFDEDDDDDDVAPQKPRRGQAHKYGLYPGSALSASRQTQQKATATRSRPNSAQRPLSGRPESRPLSQASRSRSVGRVSKPAPVIPNMEDPLAVLREEELAEKTLLALNDMRIKFPGKNDSEAEWILDKLHENWKFHKPRIASYWLVKLDSIKRRKVIDIVRSNVRAVIQKVWKLGDIDNLRLMRVINRVFNRLLWSHGQGLWNCFSPSGNSWETIFSKSSDTISATEMNCCRRIVQLCRDCLLIVYQFAAEAKTGASVQGGEVHQSGTSVQRKLLSGDGEGVGSNWNRNRAVGQRVAQLYHTRAESLGTS
ncbi:tubulin polyglutamylase TTLL7-like [Liolophura sinensis]|uniref:tubulin polyglutamylase TTLL7-like n=1 Tax=Liolophura sinensis TaxID=3198878 RepID=UPI0031580FE9